MKSADYLLQGAEVLSCKLKPLGFAFEIIEQNKGSGGEYARGRFSCGDRSIVLWFRRELGGVTYRKGNVECEHRAFMQALGLERSAKFPGFGFGDPLAGFNHLLQDLEHTDSFLLDDGAMFCRIMQNYTYKKPQGFAALDE